MDLYISSLLLGATGLTAMALSGLGSHGHSGGSHGHGHAGHGHVGHGRCRAPGHARTWPRQPRPCSFRPGFGAWSRRSAIGTWTALSRARGIRRGESRACGRLRLLDFCSASRWASAATGLIARQALGGALLAAAAVGGAVLLERAARDAALEPHHALRVEAGANARERGHGRSDRGNGVRSERTRVSCRSKSTARSSKYSRRFAPKIGSWAFAFARDNEFGSTTSTPSGTAARCLFSDELLAVSNRSVYMSNLSYTVGHHWRRRRLRRSSSSR